MRCKNCFLSNFVLFVLIISSLIVLVNAQVSWVMWNQTYGGTDHDLAYSLVATSDGGYALAGKSFSYGPGGADFWLIKTDGLGNVEWNQTYGTTNYEEPHSLVQTSDGGFALAGFREYFEGALIFG